MSYRIIIHVGPWKTGSTSLQEFFHLNRENLLRHGVLYPYGSVSQMAHHEIPNIIKGSMSRFSWLPNTSQMGLSEILKSYFDELNSNRVSTLLLSSEDFASFNSVDYSQLIGSLSQGGEFNLEIIFFDFNLENRLKSYQNQYISQGEFLDSNAIEKIIDAVSHIKGDFKNALSEYPVIVHYLNYESLRTRTEIYEKSLDLVLNSNENFNQGNWSIPVKDLNTPLPSKEMDLLNEFNRLNNNGRQFDSSCPVVFSDLFPEQKRRFNRFTQLLKEFLESDSTVPERDRAVAERDRAVAERDRAVAELNSISNSTIWKLSSPYRKLIRFIRRI